MLHITDAADFAHTVDALKVAASGLQQAHAKVWCALSGHAYLWQVP